MDCTTSIFGGSMTRARELGEDIGAMTAPAPNRLRRERLSMGTIVCA
jgi:hypothetical protein